MWIKTYSQFYQDVLPDTVWQLWTDVNNWPTWHDDLEYCTLHGDFSVGNFFILKPKGAPPVKVTLTDIHEKHHFTDCTHFFGAKMLDTHTMEIKNGGVQLSNKLLVTGPLKWLWICLVARNVANTVPNEMDALVAMAKQPASSKEQR